MFDTPDKEWRRLTDHYGRMYDEELLDLAAGYKDLTEMAQQVLRDEMKKRGLGDPASPATVAHLRSKREAEEAAAIADSAEPEAAGKHVEYTWKTPLCACNDAVEAWQIREALKRSGIESWIEGAGGYDMVNAGPRVVVGADELERARLVIAQPIPQDIIEQSHVDIPEFESPVCPRCGASDPILASVEPVNAWECEACGKEWTDPGAAGGAD